jgi:acyl-[acyl-carrier-protein] desaturase
MLISNEVNTSSSRSEVMKSMEGFVAENIVTKLKQVDKSWQPTDFLPDMKSENWAEELRKFRERAKAIPDDLLVVLIGDMVTEEALPTYQTLLNRHQGIMDLNGVSDNPWAQWSRGWTAEENRHGDLLNRYLYLTGRVDMRAVEVTIHHLIKNGFNPQTDNDPYLMFIYTSFQERATKISHRNVATLAVKSGEERLQKICGLIAGDEARHEEAYKLIMRKIFEVDPAEAVLSFAKMMRRKISMPAQLMYDGLSKNLFEKFSVVAQKLGVYTTYDYASIIQNLIESWKVSAIKGLSDTAAKAQDYVCNLPARYKKLAERVSFSMKEKFSWIYDKQV